jgi:Zn-dependent protease
VDLTPFLLAWRTTPLRDREVIDALVHPANAGPPPSPPLVAMLRRWPGVSYWSDEPDGRHLILTRPRGERPRESWALHLALFVLTFYTVTFAGAILAGSIHFVDWLSFFRVHPAEYGGLGGFLRAWTHGFSFSVPLLAILLAHEMGHYVTARRYLVDVSPPYFLPCPLVPSFIGTMGAFIRLRSILADRRQLFDVGIAGPIAGFVVAVPVLWYGLAHSYPIDPGPPLRGMVLFFGQDAAAVLGDSPITWALRRLSLGTPAAVALSPVAFAGWVGMFVTMLNLLPMSQLDGGHVLYAVLPAWHARVAQAIWLTIVVLGYFWWGWLLWGLLVLSMGRGRLSHPPVLDAYRPLPASRVRSAWGALALFVLTFAPVPFHGT